MRRPSHIADSKCQTDFSLLKVLCSIVVSEQNVQDRAYTRGEFSKQLPVLFTD